MGYWRILQAGLVLLPLLGAVAPAWAQTGADAARLAADRGHALEAKGDHDGALAAFTQAIEMHALPSGEQARLLFDRGLVLDATGKLNDAAGDYSAALILQPRFAPALNNRANVYRRQGKLADAKRDYRASLAAGNEEPEYTWYGLGVVAEAEGDSAAARQDYGHALSANPAYALAAERLQALGGTPPPAADDVIHLKPPSGMTVAPQIDKTDTAPITLQPPVEASKAEAPKAVAPLTLHPPKPRAPTPARYTPSRSAVEDFSQSSGPVLAPAPAPATGPQIQLGAWRSEEEANAGWDKAVGRAGGLLDGLTPQVVAVDLPGKGRYFRLRAVPRSDPAELCAALKEHGQDCILARD